MHQQGEQTPATPHSQIERFHQGGNWIDHVETILKKGCQNRSHAQHSFVLKSLLHIKYFQELAKVSDPEIIKHIVKYAKVVRLPKRYTVIERGTVIDHYFVILKGRVGIEKERCQEEIRNKNKIQNMVRLFVDHLAEADSKAPKRRSKKQQKQQVQDHIHFERQYKQHPIALSQLEFCDEIGEEQSIGDELHDFQGHRKYGAVTLQQSILLQINFSSVLKAIKFYNEKKLDSQHEFFRKFRCFDLFEDEQLKAIIGHCYTEERGKNDFIFKEGDSANQFYLLVEGEICITKVAKLFVENPNKLYTNRKTYIKSKKAEALPYANLEKLYNYRPKEEKIELGLITRDNIFGEEEAFLRTPRQTSAKVCSTTAVFYVIAVPHIEVALKQKKYMPQDFRDFLFANLTRKKILYRQEKFSEVVNLKNRNQLDYFFIEKDEHQDKQSPLKYKLQKINNKIKEMSPKKQPKDDHDDKEKATYDTFNFTKMISKTRDSLDSLDDPETPQQKDMVELTHATQYIQKQLNSQMVLNRLRNPTKRSINLNDPLFEPDYFINLNKQYKKMEQQYKKMRFSFKSTDKKSRSLGNSLK